MPAAEDPTDDGLRIRGDEQHEDAERHRDRYAWAAERLVKAGLAPEGVSLRARPVVLDYGCGTGYGVDIMRRAGLNAIGVEPDARVAEWGRIRWGVPIVTDIILAPMCPAAIVCFEVLEHLPDSRPLRTLTRLLALTAPEPFVIASVPYREKPYINPHHVWVELDERTFTLAPDAALQQAGPDAKAAMTFWHQTWDGVINAGAGPINMLFEVRAKKP